MKIVAAALAALVMGAPAAARPDLEIVSVHVTPRGIVCAGVCPSYKLDVSDGWVTGVYDVGLDNDMKPVQFRITHAAYSKFRQRLSALRPAEGQNAEGSCDNGEGAGKGASRELSWYGEGRTVHRNSCSGTEQDKAMWCAIMDALYAIDIDPFVGGRLKRRVDVPEVMRLYRCAAAS